MKENKQNRYISDSEYQFILQMRKDKGKDLKKGEQGQRLTAWDEDHKLMSPEKFCEYHGLDSNTISDYKLVSHTGVPYYNIKFKPNSVNFKPDDIDYLSVIKDFVSPVGKQNLHPKKVSKKHLFDRLVISDVHIGMEVNKGGQAQYAHKWNKDIIEARASQIAIHVLNNQNSNIIVVDDLGDFLDGLDGQTTRRGHQLPQNMTNQEAFDCAFKFKMILADKLCSHYEKVIFNNCCNDNHSGDFAYFLNQRFKDYCELKYKNSKVNNFVKFFNHYTIKNCTFVITHGKDKGEMKFGLKPKLDPKQIQHIENYIKSEGLFVKGNYLEVSKGDSHQKLFDEASSQWFDYYNYPAASPPSNWVGTNFGEQFNKQGVEFFNFISVKEKKHNPLKF